MQKSMRYTLALSIAIAVSSTQGFAMPKASQDYTETKTADGYLLVDNKAGAELGLAPDSGVKLVIVDGKAFKDMDRNGKLEPYEDWRLTPEKRAEDLAKRLSTEDIAGLMLYSMHQRDLTSQLTAAQQKML